LPLKCIKSILKKLKTAIIRKPTPFKNELKENPAIIVNIVIIIPEDNA
tara:strand:+ start:1162 stop:1305 length:144 start_codon:yes stop_codon:yes gene_type:complete